MDTSNTVKTVPAASENDTQAAKLLALFEVPLARYTQYMKAAFVTEIEGLKITIADMTGKLAVLEGLIANSKKSIPKAGTTPKTVPLNLEQIGAAVASGQIVAPPVNAAAKPPGNCKIFFCQMFSGDLTFYEKYYTNNPALVAHMTTGPAAAGINAKTGKQQITAKNNAAWEWYKVNDVATFNSFVPMYQELKDRIAAQNKPAQQEPDQKAP